jgi:hypothetical protein
LLSSSPLLSPSPSDNHLLSTCSQVMTVNLFPSLQGRFHVLQNTSLIFPKHDKESTHLYAFSPSNQPTQFTLASIFSVRSFKSMGRYLTPNRGAYNRCTHTHKPTPKLTYTFKSVKSPFYSHVKRQNQRNNRKQSPTLF